jgi:Tfp pilus assembly protein PilF
MTTKKVIHFQGVNYKWLAIALMLGWMGGCADSFDQASEADMNSPSAGMVRLGDQMHAQGDEQGAMEFYARAVQLGPDDVEAHEKLAALLEAHGDNKDAVAQYRVLTTLKPDDIDYRRDYGRVLIKLNQPAAARVQYEAALAMDSGDIKALNGLGVALDLLGDHAAAQKKYKNALEQKPDDMTTFLYFDRVLRRSHSIARATI